MEVKRFIGKNYDEVLNEALIQLNANKDEVIVSCNEIKGGLFKANQVELTVVTFETIMEYVKEYISKITEAMGINVSYESKIRDKQIIIKIYSDNNPILIGKNGRSLQALQMLVRQSVRVKFGKTPYISLDIADYKDKQIAHLERTAKRIAKEVSRTKIAVELDNMNAYERLIVHNAVKDMKGIYTESSGEEPNRHVVIKPKED